MRKFLVVLSLLVVGLFLGGIIVFALKFLHLPEVLVSGMFSKGLEIRQGGSSWLTIVVLLGLAAVGALYAFKKNKDMDSQNIFMLKK